jgi:hypothetical protein
MMDGAGTECGLLRDNSFDVYGTGGETRIANIDQLRLLADTPFARQDHSPLGPARLLVIASGVLDQIGDAPDQARLNAWLEALPCPVIGTAPDRDKSLPDIACDAVVSSEVELASVAANIRRSPRAAAVLVQVLRTTETLAHSWCSDSRIPGLRDIAGGLRIPELARRLSPIGQTRTYR